MGGRARLKCLRCHSVAPYSTARQARETARMRAGMVVSREWRRQTGSYAHIARIVSECWTEGSNLGATTTKPTRTPRWTALVRRACGPSASLFANGQAGRHTEDAVRHIADVVEGDEKPRQPQQAWAGTSQSSPGQVGRRTRHEERGVPEVADVGLEPRVVGHPLGFGKGIVVGGEEEVEEDFEQRGPFVLMEPVSNTQLQGGAGRTDRFETGQLVVEAVAVVFASVVLAIGLVGRHVAVCVAADQRTGEEAKLLGGRVMMLRHGLLVRHGRGGMERLWETTCLLGLRGRPNVIIIRGVQATRRRADCRGRRDEARLFMTCCSAVVCSSCVQASSSIVNNYKPASHPRPEGPKRGEPACMIRSGALQFWH
ncbi:hypothetical protein G6O67_003401 [Ophiocordyceps sinensis]|uniref:Uncharacterized protein n=1 Tax=Ophiocordyceps sinensis TaxID=72228 RepID=A0A8H4PWD9_9HYPO|nr:hypothetical protein G6O67_003401 [Ophiocordyceps sinensis]